MQMGKGHIGITDDPSNIRQEQNERQNQSTQHGPAIFPVITPVRKQ